METGRPLKIGIICYPSVGGSGVLASALGEELAARGHEIHFIGYERPFRLPAEAPRIHFHPVVINGYDLFKYPDYTLPLSVKMAEVSRDHRLDLLHVHYAVPHATAAILARDMLPAAQAPRVVTTLHGTDTTLLGRDPGYGPAIRHALGRSDAVTAVSAFLRRESERLLDFHGPVDVIHNFFDPHPTFRSREEVRLELGVGPEEVLLFHSSNLRPLKRVDLVLEAVSRLKTRARFKLLVLAGGSFAPFAGAAEQLGLAGRVEIRENVSVIEDYLQAADIGVFASETESFCLSILEAMSFGCPSVATRVGGIPELVGDEPVGRLVPSGDVTAMSAELARLIDDATLRRQLGEAARARARTRFSSAAIVPEYEALYRRVMAAAPECR